MERTRAVSISCSNITNNEFGVYSKDPDMISDYAGNVIYHNNFLNNDVRAYSTSDFWDNGPDGNCETWMQDLGTCDWYCYRIYGYGCPGGRGNYWSDYSSVVGEECKDENNDKFCDKPYTVVPGIMGLGLDGAGGDRYPFKEESGWLSPYCGNRVCDSDIGEDATICPWNCYG